MSNRTTKLVKLYVVLALFVVSLIGTSTFYEYNVTPAQALEDPKPGDVAAFFDAEAVNITYMIEPASSYKISSKLVGEPVVYHLDKVRVKAGTVPYSVFEFDDSVDTPTMHLGTPAFLKAYYDVGRLTGEYRLNVIGSWMSPVIDRGDFSPLGKVLSPEGAEEVQAALSVLASTNDTSEAAGYALVSEDELSVADLRGTYDYSHNISDTNITTFSANLDPAYARYARALSGNTSETDLINPAEVNDDFEAKSVVSGFGNLEEEGFLETLRANLAVNHTTASDPVSPDRIMVLDYVATQGNVTNYLTQEFANSIRSAVNEAASAASADTTINILGFKFKAPSKPALSVIPAQAYFDELGDGIGSIYRAGKAVISTPLKAFMTVTSKAKSIAGDAAKTVEDTLKNGLEGLKGGVDAALNVGKDISKAALSKFDDIKKSVGDMSNFVTSTATNMYKSVEGAVGGAFQKIVDLQKKFEDKMFNMVNVIPKTVGNLQWVILAGVGGIAAIIVLFFLGSKFLGSPKSGGGYGGSGYDRDRYRPY